MDSKKIETIGDFCFSRTAKGCQVHYNNISESALTKPIKKLKNNFVLQNLLIKNKIHLQFFIK